MEIVHLDFDDVSNPMGGGQGRHTFEINRRLSRRHHITVYTSRYKGSRDCVVDGIKYRRVGLTTFPGNLLAFYALMPLLARKANRADLVIEEFTSPFTCSLTPLFTSKPVIASAAFFFASFMAQKYGLPLDVIERKGIKVYRNVMAPTARIGRLISGLNPRASVSVIPYGVEPAFLTVPEGDGAYIAYMGRIDVHQKGLDTLLQALAGIPAVTRPPLRIFGGGRDVPKLAESISSLGLTQSVSYEGRVTGAARLKALAGARFVCVPSRYETFGIVVLEAMAAGRPVVGSAGIGFEEIFGETECGRLVPVDDVESLSKEVEALWGNRDRCRAMGSAARARARRFDWNEIAAERERLYERVAGE